MSNNIIDAVTQTVNSLVSALKLPDESAKANDTLGSMNFPQFSRILPYKDYDSATGLFINNKTVGFMFEARPLPGADKVSSPHWSIYCAANFPGASRSVFIWSPANWSAMISTTVCVNSAGVVNRLKSLTPLPAPTISGRRKHNFPCRTIWICP